jgi:hypothetical protein
MSCEASSHASIWWPKVLSMQNSSTILLCFEPNKSNSNVWSKMKLKNHFNMQLKSKYIMKWNVKFVKNHDRLELSVK